MMCCLKNNLDYLIASELDMMDEEHHALLDQPTTTYSIGTIRRAFIVWLYCGQRNEFKVVCDYYHRLEALESTLPAHQRTASRDLENRLVSHMPPTSPFLTQHFPYLYTQTIENQYLRRIEAIRHECIFDVSTFNGLNEVTQQEIVDASQIIKKYCIQHKVPLREFLTEFKEYTEKCGLKNTISSIEFYIKRKTIHAELELVRNYTKQVTSLQENGIVDQDVGTAKMTVSGSKSANIAVNDTEPTKETHIASFDDKDDNTNSNDKYDFHNLTISDIYEEPSSSEDYISVEYENQMKLLSGVIVKPAVKVYKTPEETEEKLEESLAELEDSFKSIDNSSTEYESDFETKLDGIPSPVIKRVVSNDLCFKLIDGYTDSEYEARETLKCRKI